MYAAIATHVCMSRVLSTHLSRTYRSMDSLDDRGGGSHHPLMKTLKVVLLQRATVPQWWAPQVIIMNLQYILEMYTKLYPVTHAHMTTTHINQS